MSTPASPHFTALSLSAAFNRRRVDLPPSLRPPDGDFHGDRVIRGMPFAFGPEEGDDVVHLANGSVEIALDGAYATYVLLVHAVADTTTTYLPGFADSAADGNALGTAVSDYTLRYAGGTRVSTPVLRRFAIQQSRIGWGASAFAAVPAREHGVVRTVWSSWPPTGRATRPYGRAECRHVSDRDGVEDDTGTAVDLRPPQPVCPSGPSRPSS